MWIFFLVVVVILTTLKFIIKLHPVEYFIQIVTALALTIIFWVATFFHPGAWDKELWNGLVSAKQHIVKDCPTGWHSSKDSFCTEYRTKEVYVGQSCTGSDKDQVCTSNYDTYYEAIFYEEGKWFIRADNLKYTWEIDRADRQGMVAPPLYIATNVGDPVSLTNSYNNWVKASADSVFHQDGKAAEKYEKIIPKYPMKFNGLTVDRIVTVGVDLPNLKQANYQLSKALGELGPKRQMNAVIVVSDASKTGSDFAYAVRRAWQGFKKNDAVIFIGVNNGNVAWSEVLSWSKESLFDIRMRNSILADRDKPLDLTKVITNLEEIGMANYKRRSMDEFEFLKDSIPTSNWLIGMFVFLQIAVASFTTAFFHSSKTNRGYRR